MSFLAEKRLFQKLATAILIFFMSLMVLVTCVAYSRRSGMTGLDMSQVQQLRYRAAATKAERPPNSLADN